MAIFTDADLLQKWRYKVTGFNLLIPNEDKITIPNERLRGLEISNLYELLYFPLIKITINVSADIYYKILKYKNKCRFHIQINRYYLEITDNGNKSINRNFINDTFSLIMDDQTEDMLNSLKEVENKGNYETIIKNTENDLFMTDNVIEFYLFKTNVGNLRKPVNKVIKNCNITDVIAYLSYKANLKNVLLAQPDNRKNYDEFLIPYLPIVKAFKFIDYYYGIFKEGSIIFFDLDYTYIIPYSGKCSVYRKNEIRNTNIIVPKSANLSFCNSICSLTRPGDKKNNYIICDYSTINIENQSISNNYIDANDVDVVDSFDGKISTGISNASSNIDNVKKVTENRTDNGMLSTALANVSSSKSVVITARLQDYDISALTPNKRMNMIFEDTKYINKYNGTYLLSSAVHTFIPDGEDLVLNTVAVFKKTE